VGFAELRAMSRVTHILSTFILIQLYTTVKPVLHDTVVRTAIKASLTPILTQLGSGLTPASVADPIFIFSRSTTLLERRQSL